MQNVHCCNMTETVGILLT